LKFWHYAKFLKSLNNVNDVITFRAFWLTAWVSKGIITGINKRNKAWNEYNEIPNYLNQNKYKMLRNKVTDMIKKANVNFEMGLVGKIKEDPKSFYA